CWEAALLPLRLLSNSALDFTPPPEWAALLNEVQPATALACAAGNFPQMVQPVSSLLGGKLAAPARSSGNAITASVALAAMAETAIREGRHPQSLLYIGLLRAAGDFDRAQSLLDALCSELPDEWRPALANEEAALAWHQGRAEEAMALWAKQSPG